MNFIVEGNIVDIEEKKIFYGSVETEDGKIVSIKEIEKQKDNAPFILPGFIDSHVHIESSMLVPTEFAKLAVVHGTIATVPCTTASFANSEGTNIELSMCT